MKTNALEAQELESNTGFLQNLALQNGGKSVGIAQMTSPDFLGSQVPKSRIEFTDWDDSLLNVFWVLALIMALATAEWTIRKVNGSL